MDDIDPEPRKQRAPSPGIVANRQSRAAVREFVALMGEWQSEAAHIEATALHDPRSKTLDDRRAALRGKLEQERRRFDDLVANLPPELQTHSRVVDVLRSLDRLEQRLADVWPKSAGRDGQTSAQARG